jgi:hypothetical protein
LSISQASIIASDSLAFINNIKLGVKAEYGYIYPHTSSIRYLVEDHINGFEVTLSTDSYGRSIWDKLYRYPQFGAGLLTATLGNKKVFGRGNALFLYIDIPFSLKSRKLSFNYQIGFGLGYLTRKFDIDKNPYNIAISSSLNFYAGFELNARYRINSGNEIKAGLSFSHFSNGKVKTPNLGINSVKLSIGYFYNIMHAQYERRIPASPGKIIRNNLYLIASAGYKTDDQITGIYYMISSIVLDYKYNFSHRYAAGLGADIFYDQSLGPNKVADKGGSYRKADLYQEAVHGAFYIRYSRLNVLLQVGGYLHANYYKYSRMFSRVGMRYQVYRNLFLNLSLKSHYGIADYIEWGICYRLH